MIERRYAALRARLDAAAGRPATQELIDAVTAFALDANESGRADLSLMLMPAVVRAAPDRAKSWQVLGLALREEQRMPEAREAMRRAAACDPADGRIAAAQALFALESGLPSAALFDRVLAASPGDPDIVRNTAVARHADGDRAGADALLTVALQQAPEWVEGHRTFGTLCSGDGRAAVADDALDRALESCPAAVPLHTLRAWRRFLAKDWAGAEAAVELGLGAAGSDARFDALRAAIATESGDLDRADRLFASPPIAGDASVALYRIRHALRRADWGLAETIAEAMIGTPMERAAWPYLSTIWRLTGNPRAGWLDGDPPFIRVVDLDIDRGALARLADVLRGLHAAKAAFPEQSVRGGTQTDKPLFFRDEPEIVAVREQVRAAVANYVAALPPAVAGHPLLGTPRGTVLFEGSWSVRLAGAGHHVAHTHTHGWISSALYVALPDGDSCGPPPAGWLELGAPPPELGLDLAPYRSVEPRPGRLALFPSTMWHGTRPFPDGERLTIAFDVAIPRR